MSDKTNTTLAALRERVPSAEDLRVSVKATLNDLDGFELTQRIANVFASSDCVPVQYRSSVTKWDKDARAEVTLKNPSGIANCIVAYETARNLGMSVLTVMQNAYIIEGRLSWSAQFIIGALNASGRFTPLEYDIEDRGDIEASYEKKKGWGKNAEYETVKVKLRNLVCTAWAYVIEDGRRTDRKVYGAPVSMELAVQEGWYQKPGSKWQTELKHMMLRYRAGAFFGRLNAPDLMMGFGTQTKEELDDVLEARPDEDGNISVNVDELRAAPSERAKPTRSRRGKADDAQDVDSKPAADAKPDTAAPDAKADPDAGFGEQRNTPDDGSGSDHQADAASATMADDPKQIDVAEVIAMLQSAATRDEVEIAYQHADGRQEPEFNAITDAYNAAIKRLKAGRARRTAE